MQYISFLWPPFEVALSILNVGLFVKHIFVEGLNKNKGYRHNCRIISLLKMMRSVLHDHDVADKPYRINVMIITYLIISTVEFITCLNQVNDFCENG